MSPNIKKWWQFKFQHTRNNLPPEQQATATSTWQKYQMNTIFFPCYENDIGGPFQVYFTSAAR